MPKVSVKKIRSCSAEKWPSTDKSLEIPHRVVIAGILKVNDEYAIAIVDAVFHHRITVTGGVGRGCIARAARTASAFFCTSL